MTLSDLFKVTIIQRQVTRKWYNIQLYLQWPTSRKSYIIYRMPPFSMTLSDLTKYSVTRSVTRSLGQLSFLFYMVQCVLYFLYFFDCPVNSCIFRKCPVFLLTWQIIAVPFCDIVYILQECACFSCCFSFL